MQPNDQALLVILIYIMSLIENLSQNVISTDSFSLEHSHACVTWKTISLLNGAYCTGNSDH